MQDSDRPILDYNSPTTPGPRWKWVRAIVPIAEWLALVAGIACAFIMLWAARLPVSNLVLLAIGFLIGTVSGFLCLLCSIAEVLIIKSQGTLVVRRATLLLATAMLLASTWALLSLEVPRRIMFHANKPAMDLWVRKLLATPVAPPWNAQVGSYDAFDIEPIPGGVKFLVEGSGFFRMGGGFAYSPPGPPPATGPAVETFTPLGGGWYLRTYEEE
jgi:hypothetical protein